MKLAGNYATLLLCLMVPSIQASQLSAPFRLAVESSNGTYRGTTLEVCQLHGGVDGLCAQGSIDDPPSNNSTFYFNRVSTTTGTFASTGFVGWRAESSDSTTLSLLDLKYLVSSNVAFANIVSSAVTGLYVAFYDNILLIPDIYDDTFRQSNQFEHVTPYYRWLICKTTFYGGSQPTLNWQLRTYAAENPTCQKVTIRQHFI